ncbi:MAG TPA: IS4 family transposase [Candidatus Angelobacter sp.]|nr:IS4 family transposase [Candidatus Angelobacter sp.]
MDQGRTVFAQFCAHLPSSSFRRCVLRYRAERYVKKFSCWDQFLCMAFAQCTQRESLRDIEAALRSLPPGRLYHLGIRGKVARATLADANESRDWRTYADFAQVLIGMARRLYREDALAVQLEQTVYALDSTTIDLCLSLFPWAPFQKSKGAIKLHTLLDLRGNIPSVIRISHGRVSDVSMLDHLQPEAGSFYVMDRGYVDFARFHRLHRAGAFFVTRAWKNLQCCRRYSHPVDSSTGLRSDQTIVLTGRYTKDLYLSPLRRVHYVDPERGLRLIFLTNNFLVPALSVAQLYKSRWQVELFFRWIKQHLRIKAFYGTSENAVKTQIWIAISVYVLAAIVKKRLGLSVSLYSFLQVLGLSLFEKTPILRLFQHETPELQHANPTNQLKLLDF